MRLRTAAIGRCGELLVQYKLLKLGFESAPMTTDAGVDLVVFAPATGRAVTVQVKANDAPKPSGGRGKLALDWWVADDCPAELVAFVDLSTDRVWIFTREELATCAQQHSSGRYHLYMYLDAGVQARTNRPVRVTDFEDYLLERKVSRLL